MDRRLVGVVVLILVVAAAITLPNLQGRRVIGSPVAAVVPGPPAAGDCVVSLAPLQDVDDRNGSQVPVMYPSASYGPCTGDLVGEVMSVDPSPHPLASATIDSYLTARSECELAEVNYVGSIGPYDPATLATPGIGWVADVAVQITSVGPSAYQRAAGQSWIACIGGTDGRSSYRGRLQNALRSGTLPSAFGTCGTPVGGSRPDPTADPPVSCATPHSYEVLGTTELRQGMTRQQIQQSCVGFAARAMRTGDPTKKGLLTVSAYPSFQDGPPPDPGAGAVGFQSCIASLTGEGRLGGTVVGIGERALPLA